MTLPNQNDIYEAARSAQELAKSAGLHIDDESLVRAAAAVFWNAKGPSLEGCETLDVRALIVKIAATYAGQRAGVEGSDYREPLTPRIGSAEQNDLDTLSDKLAVLRKDAHAGKVVGYGVVAVHIDGVISTTWGVISERAPLARAAIVGALQRLIWTMQDAWQAVEPDEEAKPDAQVVSLRALPTPEEETT